MQLKQKILPQAIKAFIETPNIAVFAISKKHKHKHWFVSFHINKNIYNVQLHFFKLIFIINASKTHRKIMARLKILMNIS